MTDMRAAGARLRAMRRAREWRLEDAVRAANQGYATPRLTLGHLSEVERGQIVRPGLEVIAALCDIYHLDPNTFFDLAGAWTPPTESQDPALRYAGTIAARLPSAERSRFLTEVATLTRKYEGGLGNG